MNTLPLAFVGLIVLGAAAEEDKTAPFKNLEILGQIVPNDLPDRERRHPCKIHTLHFAKGKTYVLDLISKDFDAWLRIADAEGKTIVQDDDSGGNLNSRIRFTAPRDENFQIVATSFAGGAGTYVLKVRAE